MAVEQLSEAEQREHDRKNRETVERLERDMAARRSRPGISRLLLVELAPEVQTKSRSMIFQFISRLPGVVCVVDGGILTRKTLDLMLQKAREASA